MSAAGPRQGAPVAIRQHEGVPGDATAPHRGARATARQQEADAPLPLAPPLACDLAAALFAVDPVGLGGVALRGAAGDARDRWLARLVQLLPAGMPWRRLPLHIDDDRLLGGLDLTATLQAGRPVTQRGLLAEADGGIVAIAMAERMKPATAAQVAAVIDTHELLAERDGASLRCESRFGVVALDEGIDDDERMPARLLERLAFHVVLDAAALPGDSTGAATGTASIEATSTSVGTVVGASVGASEGVSVGVSVGASVGRAVNAAVGTPTNKPTSTALFTRQDIADARARLAGVTLGAESIESLCGAALALGVDSLRAALQACRAARVAAALDGRDATNADDLALAAALVLAPRATRLPASRAESSTAPGTADDATGQDDADDADDTDGTQGMAAEDVEKDIDSSTDATDSTGVDDAPASATDRTGKAGELESTGEPVVAGNTRPDAGKPRAADHPLNDTVLEAALAALPRGLLATLALGGPKKVRSPSAGRAGASQAGTSRGRPVGVQRGEPAGGARLHLVSTLRAAAPWQTLRQSEARNAGRPFESRLQVRRSDFHIWRLRQRSETTTLFVLDASGSAALHRLAETKGAVELLLADCYVRRDSVAVIAFRGTSAELLLPPTRSLVRAKRSLAGLPGGGGTPLAAGIVSAHTLAGAVRRRGATPVIVLLTDGRANIARDGTPGRARATEDALVAARQLRADGFSVLLLDTSAQPQQPARVLAEAMGARYLPLPHAGAAAMSQAVRAAAM